MRPDAVITLGKSVIQHGPANDRVYLLKLDTNDLPEIVDDVYELGREHGYSKLFAKVPAGGVEHFTARGFIDEARVPSMYKGKSAGYFMCKYLNHSRAVPRNIERITKVLDCADQSPSVPPASVDTGDVVRLSPDNAEELAALYDTVFTSYPFPINEPSFIRSTMADNVIFFGIMEDDRLVAAASAELDREWRCVEMTDFATLPEHRGKGAAQKLLIRMEETMPSLNIRTAYTIARAESFGMNIVFARTGYTFSGTLHNNTQIAGKLESMNVWHKDMPCKAG